MQYMVKESDVGIGGVSIAVPFVFEPKTDYERIHGKPILLTDCEIAVILDSLRGFDANTDDGRVAQDNLWRKLMGLWNTPAPYES